MIIWMKAYKDREAKNILPFYKIAYVNLIFNIRVFSTGGGKESDQDTFLVYFMYMGKKRPVHV